MYLCIRSSEFALQGKIQITEMTSHQKPLHIAVAGNIGSGKTTLTGMLAKHYGWTPQYESVEGNPYLDDYYKDLHRWSFNLEVFFLKQRFRDMLNIAKAGGTVIQDRSIFEGVYVFVATNQQMGHMEERDYETFMELFEQMEAVVRLPDLMIYLKATVPHLVNNIQRRGRDYEQQIQLEYLERLNERYDDFISNKYKGRVLVIEKDGLDFEHNRKDFGQIVDKIDAQLFGLF